MKKPDKYREIYIYGEEFWLFYNKQNRKVKNRINWTLGIIQSLERVPEQYFKHLVGTDLYEIRVRSGRNIYRIFSFFDKGKLIIVLNAFQKKTQKTPRKEIEKANKLRLQYYEEQAK